MKENIIIPSSNEVEAIEISNEDLKDMKNYSTVKEISHKFQNCTSSIIRVIRKLHDQNPGLVLKVMLPRESPKWMVHNSLVIEDNFAKKRNRSNKKENKRKNKKEIVVKIYNELKKEDVTIRPSLIKKQLLKQNIQVSDPYIINIIKELGYKPKKLRWKTTELSTQHQTESAPATQQVESVMQKPDEQILDILDIEVDLKQAIDFIKNIPENTDPMDMINPIKELMEKYGNIDNVIKIVNIIYQIKNL